MDIETWLRNFEKDDKQYARILIDSLQLFTINDVEKEIFETLESIKEETHFGLYPVMDQKLIVKDLDYLDLLQQRKLLLPGKNNNQLNDADSEYICMHFIRNNYKMKKNFFNMPLKADIKKNKVRGIIIFTDIIASGKQVKDFINYFVKDKTIKSYISLGLIGKIEVICHLATKYAVKELESLSIYSKKNFITVKNAKYARTIEDYFTDNDLKMKIIEICMKYAKNKKYSLGFGNTGLLSIYEHRSSNNIPAVLCQSNKDWMGLITNRRINLTHENVSNERIYTESNITLFSVLDTARLSNKHLIERLAERNKINTISARSIIKSLKELGYLSKYDYLTNKGRKLYRKLSNDFEIKYDYTKIDNYVESKYYPYYKKLPNA